MHCVGIHYYQGQGFADKKAIYFKYENNNWSNFTEISTLPQYSGLNIDLSTDCQPVTTWIQETGGTGYGKYGLYTSSLINGNWTPPDKIADSSIHSSFVIDRENSYHIIEVERPQSSLYRLIDYEKKQQNWERTIIEVSDASIWNNELYSFDSSLYLIYAKRNGSKYPDNSVLFRRKDLISSYKRTELIYDLKVYPNPSFDYVTLAFTVASPTDIVIQLIDIFGQKKNELIMSNPIIGVNKVLLTRKDSKGVSFPSGIYLLNVYSEQTKTSYITKILFN